MLKTLQIKDYALIESLFVTFKSGLNIITGETGAGKSIIIDALGLILGERATSDYIRKGANRAIVECIFDIPQNSKIVSLLTNNEIDDDDELIIRREISLKGKSRAFVNDTPVSVNVLKTLGNLLVDLHGQHQHQSLLYPENHIKIVDEFAGNETLLNSFTEKINAFHNSVNSLNNLISRSSEIKEKKEFYEFQINEIDSVAPVKNEDDLLNNELKILENSELLFSSTSKIFEELYDSEEALYNRLVAVEKQLESLAKIDNTFGEKAKEFGAILSSIDDVSEFVRKYKDTVNVEPSRLDEIRERFGALNLLKKKFGGSITSILEHREKIGNELEGIDNLDNDILLLQQNIEIHRTELAKIAKAISENRLKIIEKISEETEKQLSELGIADSDFQVKITKQEFTGTGNDFVIEDKKKHRLFSNGTDIVEFFISTNIGEDLKPIAKVASGGEISRIMLAMKTVLARKDKLPLLIFDEIDTGVSGRIASKVGKAMKTLSKNHQIIAITHLPQIARFANSHFMVEKLPVEGRVLSNIRQLGNDEKIEEIAKLISGDTVTTTSLKSARELLSQK